MWHVILLGLLGGVLAGNGPIPNLLAGWSGFVLAAVFLWLAHLTTHPVAAFASVSAGVLLIGLFHAWPGAFGHRTA
jgi:hypothetical protein